MEIDSRLKVEDQDIIIDKSNSSGFSSTDLKEKLLDGSFETLYFCGLDSIECLGNTIRDARYYGFNVVLISDGHSTYSTLPQMTIDRVNKGYEGKDKGSILTSEELVFN
jgi:nicotinamidase-related amidase